MQLFMQRLLVSTMVNNNNNNNNQKEQTVDVVEEPQQDEPSSSSGILRCQLHLVTDNHKSHQERAYASDPHFELYDDDDEEEEDDINAVFAPRRRRSHPAIPLQSYDPASSSSNQDDCVVGKKSNSNKNAFKMSNTYTSLHDHCRAVGLTATRPRTKKGGKRARRRVRPQKFQPSKMLGGFVEEEDEDGSERSRDPLASQQKPSRWSSSSTVAMSSDPLHQPPSNSSNNINKDQAPTSPTCVAAKLNDSNNIATSESSTAETSVSTSPSRSKVVRHCSSDMILLDGKKSDHATNRDRPPRRPRHRGSLRRSFSSD